MRGFMLALALVCEYRVGCDCGARSSSAPCVEVGDSGAGGGGGGLSDGGTVDPDAGADAGADAGPRRLGDGGVQLVPFTEDGGTFVTATVAVTEDDRVLVVAGLAQPDGGRRYVLYDVREDGQVAFSTQLLAGATGAPSLSAAGAAAVTCIPTRGGLYLADLATPSVVTPSFITTSPDAGYASCPVFVMSDGTQLLSLSATNGTTTSVLQRTSSSASFGSPHTVLADAGQQGVIYAASGHACAVASINFARVMIDRFSTDAGWSSLPTIPLRQGNGSHGAIVLPVEKGCFVQVSEFLSGPGTSFFDAYSSELDGGWTRSTPTVATFLSWSISDGIDRAWIVTPTTPPTSTEFSATRGWSPQRALDLPSFLYPGLLATRPASAVFLNTDTIGLSIVELVDGGSSPSRLIVGPTPQPYGVRVAMNTGGLYGGLYLLTSSFPALEIYVAIGRLP